MKKTVKIYQIIIFVLIIIICALVYLRYKDNKVVIENRQEPGDTLELMQKNEYALEYCFASKYLLLTAIYLNFKTYIIKINNNYYFNER